MKTLAVIGLLTVMIMVSSCKKSGNGNDQGSTPDSTLGALMSVTPSQDTLYVSLLCGQSFTITNTGAAGSILKYKVLDDGPYPGFLNITDSIGSLAAGQQAVVTVSLKTNVANEGQVLPGKTLKVDFYRQKGASELKTAVPVYVKTLASMLMPLAGTTWKGTWQGYSVAYSNLGKIFATTPVNGTWQLNIDTFTPTDINGGMITGSLFYQGTDAYWLYKVAPNGTTLSATPYPLSVCCGVPLVGGNAGISYHDSCTFFHLKISGSSTDHNYGPNWDVDIDMATNKIVSRASEGFFAIPQGPLSGAGLSHGTVTGSKQ